MRTSAWTPDGSLLACAEVQHMLLKCRPPIPVTTVCVTVHHGDGTQPHVVHEVELRDSHFSSALVAWGEMPDALGRWVLAIVYGDCITLVAVSGAHEQSDTLTTLREGGITTANQVWWVAQGVFAVGEQQVDEYRVHVFQLGAEHHKTRRFPGVRHAAPTGTKLALFDKDGSMVVCDLSV